VLGVAGFDWLLLDGEHSPNDVGTFIPQLMALKDSASAPIARPASNNVVEIKRLLDAGFYNLLVPFVQSADDARRAVAATRYPPAGVRGVAGTTRATRFGRVKDYARRAHEEICVLVQVETRKAMSNLEAIAEVEGVDGIFIGPNDLSADLGYLGNWQHPEVWKVMEDAAKRIRKAGKAPGILVGEADGKRCLDLGYLFVAVGADTGMLVRGSDTLAAKFK